MHTMRQEIAHSAFSSNHCDSWCLDMLAMEWISNSQTCKLYYRRSVKLFVFEIDQKSDHKLNHHTPNNLELAGVKKKKVAERWGPIQIVLIFWIINRPNSKVF